MNWKLQIFDCSSVFYHLAIAAISKQFNFGLRKCKEHEQA